MPEWTPVSARRHQGWARVAGSNYRFAAGLGVTPVVGAELPRLVRRFAVFLKPLEPDDLAQGYEMVALLTLTEGQSAFVGTDGRWRGDYIPASLRAYPFALAPDPRDGQILLCLDEASDRLSAAGDGQALFDLDGKPGPHLAQVRDFLTAFWENRKMTLQAISALQAVDLIQPVQLSTRVHGAEQTISGLWSVDESRLNALDDASFARIRHAGALPLAYTLLMSRGNIEVLERLTLVTSSAAAASDDDWLLGGDEDTLLKF